MSEPRDIPQMAEALRVKLAEVHGIKGRTLETALRRSARFLPRGLRRRGLALAAAARDVGNPRLEPMLDLAALRDHYTALKAHLDAVDVADLRRGRILRLLGAIALNLLLVGTAFVAWMLWRGYL